MSNTAGGNGSLGAEIFRKDALLKKHLSGARESLLRRAEQGSGDYFQAI